MHGKDSSHLSENSLVKTKKYVCDICSYPTNNLKAHKYNKHIKKKDHQCRRCKEEFAFKSELKYHIKYQKIKCKESASKRPKQKVPRIKKIKAQGDKVKNIRVLKPKGPKIHTCEWCPYKN